jgi:two-component system OmpR family sensor kinase
VSLRLRLTLVYSLLFAILIAGFGIIVYTQTSKRLYSSVDDTLRTREDRILSEATDTSNSGSTFTIDQSVLDEISAPGVYVEVLRSDGSVVARSNNLSGELPFHTRRRIPAGAALIETHETDNGERVRVLYQEVALPGDAGARLLVARSLHPTDAALDRIRIVLIGGSLSRTDSRTWLPLRRCDRCAACLVPQQRSRPRPIFLDASPVPTSLERSASSFAPSTS